MAAERTLLFRAHNHIGSDPLSAYDSSVELVKFDGQFRQQHSVREFLLAIDSHLGKTEKENSTGMQKKTYFTSTSSILEWALHLTRRKWQSLREDEQASLVIFDLQKLCRIPDVRVFRVSIIHFIQTSDNSDTITSEHEEWAKNCDEYVIIGQGIEGGIVQAIPWSRLEMMPIINQQTKTFTRTYTLGIYRQWKDEALARCQETNREEVCAKVIESAKLLAMPGSKDVVKVQLMIEHIIKPGIEF